MSAGLPGPVTAGTKDNSWTRPVQWPELPTRGSTWLRSRASASAPNLTTASLPGERPDDSDHDGGHDAEKGDFRWPILAAPANTARKLSKTEIVVQRALFIVVVVVVNVGLAAVTVFAHVGVATLVFILLFKLQDCLSSIISIVCVTYTSIAGCFIKPAPVPRKWVLSLLPAYNESEEQILKSIRGLRNNVGDPHRQVVAIVLDGQPKELRGEFSRVVAEFSRPYHSLKCKSGTLRVTAGFWQELPVIMMEKGQNSGKKDSLVLAHDLFNCPRDDMGEYTRLLRREMWERVLPALTAGTGFGGSGTAGTGFGGSDTAGTGFGDTAGTGFGGFDMVFCTDADSVIHEGCMPKLIDGLARDGRAIAACGLVLVEFEEGYKWSAWNLFQMLQYSYGQTVRRLAEGFVGKVTCLPGCVTMTAVRPEMAAAVAMFARPVRESSVLHHQVQNLGTDRRLTYCMLSQGTALRTLFVRDAVAETVAPQSAAHYLSQRRRWGSNAYFNNFFYCGGRNMVVFTRLVALLHVARQTCVYYRVLNTVLFIRALVIECNFMDVLPLLVVGQFPLLWFVVCALTQRALRVRLHQIVLGFFINKVASPVLSCVVFFAVMTNLGNAVWGISGVTASSASSQRPGTQGSQGTGSQGTGSQGTGSEGTSGSDRPGTQSSTGSQRGAQVL